MARVGLLPGRGPAGSLVGVLVCLVLSASRSASRSAGATASGARATSQDSIKARKAPTGDSQRDAALAGISSKLDKLRQHNQQRQPTQAPTRTHHPRR